MNDEIYSEEVYTCQKCGASEFCIERDSVDGIDYYFVSCRNCLEVFGKVEVI